VNRRHFLSKTAKGLIAGAVPVGIIMTTKSSLSIVGANERINLALMGCGGRGHLLARNFISEGVQFSYVCDAHAGRMEDMAQLLSDLQGGRPKKVNDIRMAFDDKDVDAVVIATPHHWHALPTIQAVQSGKDVYLEKPASLTIWEDQKMREAAKKYDRIVQIGTQNRSAPYVHAAKEYIRNGSLGDIHLVKVFNLKPNSPFIDRGKPFFLGDSEEPPKELNWDLWLGGSPARSYYPAIFNNYGWVAFWDFSLGDLDDAYHQIDIAHYLMGEQNPETVSSSGGRFYYKSDDAEIPDTQVCSYEFDNFVMTLEMSGYPTYMRKTTTTIRRNDEFPYWTQNATRIELYGSKELMILGRMGGGWVTMTSGGKVVEKMYGRVPDVIHIQNFLDCLKSRKRPNADISLLHKSINAAHMSNIAYRVGNKKLYFDSKTEKFLNDDDANKLIKREYREKYRIPDIV
jgi:predicted dehydrogenase